MTTYCMTRREALGTAAAAGFALSPAFSTFAADTPRRFKIGACDWSIGRGGQLSALELAKEIGLDGVQVSFSKPGGQYDLRPSEKARAYETVTFTIRSICDPYSSNGLLVHRLCLGTHRIRGSASKSRQSLQGTSFPGRAWERGAVSQCRTFDQGPSHPPADCLEHQY